MPSSINQTTCIMALFRCTKCGHLQEASSEHLNKMVKCPACAQPGQVYPTVPFVKNLLDRYFEQRKLAQTLESELSGLRSTANAPAEDTMEARTAPENLFHTTALAEPVYHEPVQKWFAARQIETRIDLKAVDTTGLYDDIAVMLGDHLSVLYEILDKIRYCQRKHYADVKLVLTERSQKEVALITHFCALLYQAAFVTRYVYQKKEKVIRLGVQQAPTVTAFFAGGWLEWYALMKVLVQCQDRQLSFACTRNLELILPNEDKHELDVFFLIEGDIPICIECKSGEFRHDIDKYLRLCKKMGLDKQAFILCATDLETTQTEHLSSMHGLRFTNPQNLPEQIEQLCQKRLLG
jgi:hypothetical protein